MTPIERATEALIAQLRRQEPEKGGTYWVSAGDPANTVIDGTFDLLAIVRTVLQAIREPSEAMVEVVGNLEPKAGWWPDEPGQRNSPDEIWRAMIDAALEQG